jgi:hypothetical protein
MTMTDAQVTTTQYGGAGHTARRGKDNAVA